VWEGVAKRRDVGSPPSLPLRRGGARGQGNSRLLSKTRLQLPTRAHLRWVESDSPPGKSEFPKLLPAFLRKAFPGGSVLHPLMPEAADAARAWVKDEGRPGRGASAQTSVAGVAGGKAGGKDAGKAGQGHVDVGASERIVTGVRLRGGETKLRVGWDGTAVGLPSLEVWQTLSPAWGGQLADFLLVSVGAIARDVGRARWERLLRLCGLLGGETDAGGDAMDTDDDWDWDAVRPRPGARRRAARRWLARERS
jgi:hypothetical protein